MVNFTVEPQLKWIKWVGAKTISTTIQEAVKKRKQLYWMHGLYKIPHLKFNSDEWFLQIQFLETEQCINTKTKVC